MKASTAEKRSTHSQLLSLQTVAKICQVDDKTIRRWIDQGRIPVPMKIGRLLRWKQPVIADWIDNGCPRVSSKSII